MDEETLWFAKRKNFRPEWSEQVAPQSELLPNLLSQGSKEIELGTDCWHILLPSLHMPSFQSPSQDFSVPTLYMSNDAHIEKEHKLGDRK